ncbi:MAG TPA: HEAT repeat domain-containing protein [Acidimicrobiales bacterium]|nr:HEAT repeat domain-containing protein [Acidimicrobiales bacterium]
MSDARQRRRAVALAGHEGDEAAARAGLTDPEPAVRSTALGALERLTALRPDDVASALADPDPAVRRRACEAAAAFPGDGPPSLLAVLGSADATVVEVAAWACGERQPPEPGAVERLSALATGHDDALVREAAVAALGAIGDEAGLSAILAATTDKATVRRRAVIALAPFEGPEVDAALERARGDRDWQVRQAAEDLSD